MLPLGRGLFWILGLCFILLLLATLGRLPPVVASHFDAAGAPNGWSSRGSYAILLAAIGVLLPLGIIGLVTALTQRGPQLLNIPARDYWRRLHHDRGRAGRSRPDPGSSRLYAAASRYRGDCDGPLQHVACDWPLDHWVVSPLAATRGAAR
jgi:hypothetical protein